MDTINGQVESDGYGSFDSFISELESSEQSDVPTQAQPEDTEPDAGEAFEGMLNIVLTIAEQATSIISDVEFNFDDKSKAAIVDAAKPVINKHGKGMLGAFGDYMEEATLIMALLALMYTSKRQLKQLKHVKQEAEHNESKRVTQPD